MIHHLVSNWRNVLYFSELDIEIFGTLGINITMGKYIFFNESQIGLLVKAENLEAVQ